MQQSSDEVTPEPRASLGALVSTVPVKVSSQDQFLSEYLFVYSQSYNQPTINGTIKGHVELHNISAKGRSSLLLFSRAETGGCSYPEIAGSGHLSENS